MSFYSRLLAQVKNVAHGFDAPADEPQGLVRCHQVHGDAVLVVGDEPPEALRPTKADALVTTRARTLGVQTADCLPVLFAERNGRAIAATHAGWRGLNLGVLLRTIDRLRALGAPPDDLVAAIGPAIGPCCFEVNREVVDAFEREWGKLWTPASRPWHDRQPASRSDSRGRAPVSDNDLWVDLEKIARLQLVAAGVSDSSIEDVGHCTYCGPGDLASYRRGTHEGLKASRQWSWIRKL